MKGNKFTVKSLQICPILLGIISALILPACGGKKAAENDSDTVKAPVDTSYLHLETPDLAMRELQGDVESCVLEYYFMEAPEDITTDSVTFTPQGNLLSVTSWYTDGGRRICSSDVRFETDADGNYLPAVDRVSPEMRTSIERDALGRIVVWDYAPSDNGAESDKSYLEEYSWGDDDLLKGYKLSGWEYSSRAGYEYDADGRRSNTVTVSDDIEFHSTDTQTYTYKKFDERGNWIEREVRGKTEYDDEGHKSTSMSLRIDKRRIRYHSDPRR